MEEVDVPCILLLFFFDDEDKKGIYTGLLVCEGRRITRVPFDRNDPISPVAHHSLQSWTPLRVCPLTRICKMKQ